MNSFLKKLKTVFVQVWAWVTGVYDKLNDIADVVCPIAIKVVDGVKTVNNSIVTDVAETIITSIIPGTADDKIIQKVRAWLKEQLPVWATSLNIVQSIADIDDPNEQLKAICNAINISSDDAKNVFYHTLASKIIEVLSDGKITWSEAVILAEYYYNNKQ